MTSQTSIPVPAIRGRLPEGPSTKRIPGHLRSRMASESNSLVSEENSLPLASADSSIALAISVGMRKLLWTVPMVSWSSAEESHPLYYSGLHWVSSAEELGTVTVFPGKPATGGPVARLSPRPSQPREPRVGIAEAVELHSHPVHDREVEAAELAIPVALSGVVEDPAGLQGSA